MAMESTISLNKSNPKIEDFLGRVVSQVYTKEEADEIRLELYTHIEDLSGDYIAAGHSVEEAIQKALYAMGDPKEIGYSFRDFGAMQRRTWMRRGMKLLAIALVVAFTAVVIWFADSSDASGNNANGVQLTQTQEERTSELTPLLVINFQVLMLAFNIYNARRANRGRYYKLPIKLLKFSDDPILVLWPYGKKTPWEYLLLLVFILPFFVTFGIIMAFDGENPLWLLYFLGTFIGALWLFIRSEAYRIPKYLIVKEGVIIKNKLMTWTAIEKVSWTRDYRAKEGKHHILMLQHGSHLAVRAKVEEDKKMGRKKRNHLPPATMSDYITEKICVNDSQYKQVASIIKAYI